MISVDYKAIGEKLLRVDVDFRRNKIREVKISGDFFLYPEDVIIKIERKLKGKRVDDGFKTVKETIQKIINEENVQMIGLSVDSIVNALKECYKMYTKQD